MSKHTPTQSDTPETAPNRISVKTRVIVWSSFLILLAGLAWNHKTIRVIWKLSSAREAIKQRNPEQALAVLNEARELDPQNGEVHYMLAKSWRRLGRLDKVSTSLERASELGFDVNLLRREQWLAAAQAGQMSIAEPHLSELLIDPQDDGAAICEAFVNGYFRIGNPIKAKEIIDAWKKDFPDDERPWICYASFHETSQDWEAAEQNYREAIKRAPSDSLTMLSLAKVLVKQHKFREATEFFEQCLKDLPNSSEVLEAWSDCLWEMGRTDEAASVFQDVLKRSPESQFARWGYARWLSLNQKYEEALAYLEALVEEFPYEREYRHAFSRALQATEQVERASEQFRWLADAEVQLAKESTLEQEISDDPSNAEARYQLGMIRLRYSSPEEGVRMLLSVLDIEPDHDETRKTLSEYYRKQGNEQMAEKIDSPPSSNPPKSDSNP